MKCLFTASVLFIVVLNCQSQTLIPLKIDSLYTWSWSRGFEPEFDTVESFTGYTYDSNDTLVQTRRPGMRTTYTYVNDTLIKLNEILDEHHAWIFFSRVKTLAQNGIVLAEFTEKFENNTWVNSSRRTYSYNALGKEFRHVIQHWKNDAWADFFKKESFFDGNGNKIEEQEFSTYENGVFEYSNGYLFFYDNANHLIERTHINTSVNGPYYTATENWAYGNDDVLDTYERCHYLGQNCRNVTMVEYAYPDQHTTVGNGYRWENNAWSYHGQTLIYRSPPVFSNEPDSIVYYKYLLEEKMHIPTIRRVLSYMDLGNQNIYFKDVTYTFFEEVQEWQRTALREEWYHIQTSVGINNPAQAEMPAHGYPNPCTPGQIILFQIETQTEDVQILTFDLGGRLVSSQKVVDNTGFKAPKCAGFYTAVFKNHQGLLGAMKLVVTD